ncbi:hypothetical protein ACP70R_028704 [Stipagrostis hirtigluma subsp. patula]
MKVLEDLVAPAVVADLVSRLISFLMARYVKRACREGASSSHRLELLALKIHAVVDEAEGRHLAHNRRLLLWLSKLMEGMYRAYYVLDVAAHPADDHGGCELVSSSWSSSSSRLTPPAKRIRTAGGGGDDHHLSAMLARLEEAAVGMKEFILVLACCPRIVRPPVVPNFSSDDKFMFGRLVEREQIITFLLQPESNLGVLPVVGGPEVGKGTIVKHVCSDERVRNHFSLILYSYGSLLDENWGEDVLGTLHGGGHVLHESPSVSGHGRHLLVIKNTYEVVINDAAWVQLCTSLRSSTAPGSKIIVISENDRVADLGTVAAMRVKPLPREEYWYFFRSLSLGGKDPGEHPELAALGRQIAEALHGSFFGAKVLGGLLRMNLNAQFWRAALNAVQSFHATLGEDDDHFSKLGVAKIALKTLPVPLRLKSSCQTDVASGLAGVTLQQLLNCPSVPQREEMRVVLWESAYPPNYRYTVVCEKVERRPCVGLERKRRTREQQIDQ